MIKENTGGNPMIEIRLNVEDMSLDDGPEKYFDWLEAKLKEAGIPVDGDNLLHGVLTRFCDPNDFGVTIYKWEPNAGVHQGIR